MEEDCIQFGSDRYRVRCITGILSKPCLTGGMITGYRVGRVCILFVICINKLKYLYK